MPQQESPRWQHLCWRLRYGLLPRLAAVVGRVWAETKAALATAGCAALVTVILGGIVGNSVLVCAQRRSKSEELEQLRRNKAAELALQAENQCAKDRLATVIAVQGQAFKAATSGEKHLGQVLRWRSIPGQQRSALRDSVQEFRSAYADWAERKETADRYLGFYFPDNRAVKKAWDDADESVEAFLGCVAGFEPGGGEDERTEDDPCGNEYRRAQASLSTFGQVVDRAWSEPCPVPDLPKHLGESDIGAMDERPSTSILSCLRETLDLRGP